MTLGLAVAVLLTIGFFNIARDVLLKDEIVDIDRYLIHTVYGWREDWLTGIFKFFTYMGGIEAMLVFLWAVVIFAWRQRLLPIVFCIGLFVAVGVSQLMKLIFGRLRPEEAFRLVVENGFSFPSGHTFVATLMYGLAGYLLVRTIGSRAWQWVAGVGALLLILLVGFSRIYLGVHFPSDVLASMAFASAFLVLIVTAIEINHRYRLKPWLLLEPAARQPILMSLALTVLVGLLLHTI